MTLGLSLAAVAPAAAQQKTIKIGFISTFSGPVAGLTLFERFLPQRAISLLGLGPALIMMSYPGVLLSTTSTPMWTRNRWLGALLAASSMSTVTKSTAAATH